jgi:hypothetical protein
VALGLFLVGVPAVGAQSSKGTNATPATSAQQGTLPIVPGQRVRVTSKQLVTPLVANFLESRADTLVFFEGGNGRGIWSLTLDQIDKVETTIGEKKSVGRYMVIGGLLGAGAVGLGAAFYASNYHPGDSTREFNNVKSGLIGAVIGGGIGVLIGSRFGAEKWREVPMPRRISFAPDAHGRWALKASVTF